MHSSYVRAQHYIQGNWISDGSEVPVVNPSNSTDFVGTFPDAAAATAEAAVQAADAAAEGWGESSILDRERILDQIGMALIEGRKRLGLVIALETGKLLATAEGEVERAGQFFRYYAASALRQHGEIHPGMVPNSTVAVTREPVGVVGLVTPWNFPIAIPAWKIAPALAHGNTVVFKPSEFSSLTAYELCKIIDQSDLPKGVFNMVLGAGTAGQAVSGHPVVKAVSFTGSRATGQKIATSCAARGTKVQMEMGGKNPLVVLKDADIDQAVAAAVDGAFGATGQRCTASSRIIVENNIIETFRTRFVEKTQALIVGGALDDGVQIGPVISQAQLEKNRNSVLLGLSEGASLLTPDHEKNVPDAGFFMKPVIFETADNDLRINQEEVFGPVASLIPADSYDHALDLANATPFGLASGIFTSSLKYAEHFKSKSRAGVVRVNMMTPGSDYHVPFGGTRASSFGSREQGEYAVEFFTTVKTSYTRFL